MDVHKLFVLPKWRKLLAIIMAEFVGTFLLLLFGCITLIGDISLLQVAIAWGTIVGHLVLIFFPISGCHINPGVTLSAVVLGSLSPALALIYFACQFLGSTLGFLTLKNLIGKELWLQSTVVRENVTYGVCCTFPRGVNTIQATFLEFFGTAFLILIVCSNHDFRTEYSRESFPLKVAVVITAVVICIGEITGASLNTARTVGPAIIQNVWKDQWVYWAGPLGAGLITPLLYMLVWMPKKKPENMVDGAVMNNLFVALRKGPENAEQPAGDEYTD